MNICRKYCISHLFSACVACKRNLLFHITVIAGVLDVQSPLSGAVRAALRCCRAAVSALRGSVWSPNELH